jgi:hypothetical protein
LNILTQAACKSLQKEIGVRLKLMPMVILPAIDNKPFRVQKEHVSKMEKKLVTFKPKPFAQNSITESDEFEIPQPTN